MDVDCELHISDRCSGSSIVSGWRRSDDKTDGQYVGLVQAKRDVEECTR